LASGVIAAAYLLG